MGTPLQPELQPWDQRLCAVPDADLFKVIGKGRASVVTDKIVRFTKTGIELESGRELSRHHRHRHRPEVAAVRRDGPGVGRR